MATEIIVVFGLCGVLLVVIASCSWCRRRLSGKESQDDPNSVSRIQEAVIDGQRTFRIATVSRNEGQLSLEVYEIRLPRQNESPTTASINLLPQSDSSYMRHLAQPPPPFSTAISMPIPSSNCQSRLDEESHIPPPRYDEVISVSRLSTISEDKQLEDLSSSTEPPQHAERHVPVLPLPANMTS